MASASQCKSLVLLESPSRVIVRYDSGRTVDRVIAPVGSFIGRRIDTVASKRGWGPIKAIERIQNILGEANARDQVLQEMYIFWRENHKACHKFSDLQKECLVLMKYTLPSESLGTQLTAFKGIVSLTTNYPYLRKFFHGFKKLRRTIDKEKAALDLWKRSESPNDREWAFFGQMAAACLSDRDVTGVVESTPPNEMGLTSDKDGGLIEILLRIINSCSYYEMSCAVGTRYLGGILESSLFWEEIDRAPHKYIVQTLLNATKHLVKDIGIECEIPLEPKTRIFSDTEGVDILTHSILVGVKVWLKLDPTRRLETQYWSTAFKALFKLILLENAHRLLPRSRSQVIREYAWLIEYKEGQSKDAEGQPNRGTKSFDDDPAHKQESPNEDQAHEPAATTTQQPHSRETLNGEQAHKPFPQSQPQFSPLATLPEPVQMEALERQVLQSKINKQNGGVQKRNIELESDSEEDVDSFNEEEEQQHQRAVSPPPAHQQPARKAAAPHGTAAQTYARASLLAEAAREAKRQQDLFKPLPPEVYSSNSLVREKNLASLSRGGRAPTLTRLLNPDPWRARPPIQTG